MEDDIWDKMMGQIAGAIGEALDSGTPYRCSLQGNRNITIDIYESKDQMVKFDEMILEAAQKDKVLDA